MLSSQHPDRIDVVFDDPGPIATAGLVLPLTLAQHLGLGELVESHLELGDAPGGANPAGRRSRSPTVPTRRAVAAAPPRARESELRP